MSREGSAPTNLEKAFQVGHFLAAFLGEVFFQHPQRRRITQGADETIVITFAATPQKRSSPPFPQRQRSQTTGQFSSEK